MEKIVGVHGRQVLDCKCRPAVEVDIYTEHGYRGTGCAPTGSSVGSYESFLLRDGDPGEYEGMSVHKAVAKVNECIAPAITGMDVFAQRDVDAKLIAMDGTADKHVLGGNTIYSVSIACIKAAAAAAHMELADYIAGSPDKIKDIPVSSFNLINGGKFKTHVMPFNETMLVPYKASSVEEMAEIAVMVFKKLPDVINRYFHVEPTVGNSYGWVFPSSDPEDNLKMLSEAADCCGYLDKVAFAFDCASSEMYDSATNTYCLKGKQVSSAELIAYVKELSQRWKLVFVEDLLDENDWAGYAAAHREITETLLLGDDFIATNPRRLARAVQENCLDGFILKPNQIGSLTEAFDTFRYGERQGLISIPSGRSGGVLGDIVVDLALALQVPFMKTGCPKSGERIAKINYLLTAQDRYPQRRLSDISSLVRFN